MAKSEGAAATLFKNKLVQAMKASHIIYVISEKEQLSLLPDGAVKVLVIADLGIIKERFKERMNGTLPMPVDKMLEKKHGMFDDGDYSVRYDSSHDDLQEACQAILEILE